MSILYQINTRVSLNQLSRSLGRRATLDDIPDAWLDRWRDLGMDWIWLLSVWQTGARSREVSRKHPEWRKEFERTTPDLTDDDIEGSGFAIAEYVVHENLGGDGALARLRSRLYDRGMRLMLDFVPNHMGLDHPWLDSNPEYFHEATREDLARAPQNYFLHPSGRVFAYGRDPNFDGWPDTAQLNYHSPALPRRMNEELVRIAAQCDGVRCDMAMLLLPDVYERTWRAPPLPFWEEAISRVKGINPDFKFLAEVYWDREWELQQLGFDYCYDKRLYDRLVHESAASVREHLIADLDYQKKLARFLENHDEARIPPTLPCPKHFAAAIITYLTPGLKFFHEGQFIGRCAKVTPHVVRAPWEEDDLTIQTFYDKLLPELHTRYLEEGRWMLLEPKPAWPESTSHDSIVAFRWKDPENRHLIAVVNYSTGEVQGRIRLTIDRNCVSEVVLKDRFTQETFRHHRGMMLNPGFPVKLGPWEFLVLEEVDND